MRRFIQKVKLSLAHKHTWQEDQWGKRCQGCGRVRTRRGERFDAKLSAFVWWFVTVLAVSLAISGFIMQMIYPINEQVMERVQIAMGDSSATFLYLFCAFMLIFLMNVWPKKEEKI